MLSKSEKIEIVINDKADEVIVKLFKSLIKKYEIGLQHNDWQVVISYLIVFIYYIMKHETSIETLLAEKEDFTVT